MLLSGFITAQFFSGSKFIEILTDVPLLDLLVSNSFEQRGTVKEITGSFGTIYAL